MKLLDHILDAHIVTLTYLLFCLVIAEQVVTDHLSIEALLDSEAFAIAIAGVAAGRGLAAKRRP